MSAASKAPLVEVFAGDFLTADLDALDGWDHIITDPPFSPHVHEKATSTGSAGKGPVSRDLGFEPLTPELREAIAACAAETPGWSIVFADYEGVHDWRADVELAGVQEGTAKAPSVEWVRLVPWVRWSQPQITGDRPPSGSEAVLHFHAKGRKAWYGDGGLTAYTRRAMRGVHKHPTQKPIDLMLDLVSWYTKPGDVVMDPCAGAGTTALACRLLGRGCIAFERDPKWAGLARARVGLPDPRDVERAQEWVVETIEQAEGVPKDDTAPGAWNRAQHRLEDAYTVAEAL